MEDFQDHLCRRICTQYPVYAGEVFGLLQELHKSNVSLDQIDSGVRSFLCSRVLLFCDVLAQNNAVQTFLIGNSTSEDLHMSILPGIHNALRNQALIGQVLEVCGIDRAQIAAALMHGLVKRHDVATTQAGPVPPMQQVHQAQPPRQSHPTVTPQQARPGQPAYSSYLSGQHQSTGSGPPSYPTQPGRDVSQSPRVHPVMAQIHASNQGVHFADDTAFIPPYGSRAHDTSRGDTMERPKRSHITSTNTSNLVPGDSLDDLESDPEPDPSTLNARKRGRLSNDKTSGTDVSQNDGLTDYEADYVPPRSSKRTRRSTLNAVNYRLDIPMDDQSPEDTTDSILVQQREQGPTPFTKTNIPSPETSPIPIATDSNGKFVFTEALYKPNVPIRPTADGQFWSVTQDKWDRAADRSKWIYHRAFLLCETTAGRDAESPCTECRKRGIACKVFVDQKKHGTTCACCMIFRRQGCSHNSDKWDTEEMED